MADNFGFLKTKRETFSYRPVCERIKDYNSIVILHPEEKTQEQSSRCMNCGTAFCNWGCPIGNYIPEWNDHVHRGRWEGAFLLLNATNPLPEVTGRVCPALCEYACVLGINDSPVTIRDNELAIIEKAFKEGYIKPLTNIKRTDKKVAVVGSGPAGLSAAYYLNYYGHNVTVFERDEKVGGFLRYGIPDFKLEKYIIDRRINLMTKEGIKFITKVAVGKDYPVTKLLSEFDAIVVAIGCRVPRDLNIPGRELKGIYQAVDYLTQTNKRVSGEKIDGEIIDAAGKKVVVIGGGDTGADCVGTAIRQEAKCVVQIEIMPQPPKDRPSDQPWPYYPFVFRKSTSHEEAEVERKWSIITKEFIGKDGKVNKIKCAKCDFIKNPKPEFKEISGTYFEINADMVILSMGFTSVEKNELIENLGLALDNRGNIKRDSSYKTSNEKVFVAGDAGRGPSLIVWAIAEGKNVAKEINKFLMKNI
ncbi:MAG: glutamate synthase subunit beta [Candidatus Goldbacteria bacterium]|nr:glutamate synthase subunit beta [Candidatus Goldiibacteriota bacterium]